MSKVMPTSKATLFNNLNGLSVAYVNHEGAELPLKNIKDFDDAIKSAKVRGRDHLDLIFYDAKLTPNQTIALNAKKSANFGTNSKKRIVAMPVKNNTCQCNEAPLPDWFKKYMKKFKKDFLMQLRSNITEIVLEEFKKEKKLAEAKLCKPLPDKKETSSPAKLKKKKKISDKDTLDLLERREIKLLKKVEKLHSSKFDRQIYPIVYLEKLESKARTLLEEKRKLEKGRQSKSRDAKKTCEPETKPMKSKKSALFRESDVFLTLKPGAEFSIPVNVLNNGTVPWESPRLVCFNTPAFCLMDHSINLPKLEPGQSVDASLRGRVTKSFGKYYFTYKLFDGLEEFGPSFSCFIVVSDTEDKVVTVSFEESNHNSEVAPSGGLVGTLIDFEKDVIASSQKKIKENIIEIERRLQDIDLLRPCTSGDESRVTRLSDNTEEFEARECDLLHNKERKCWKERLEEEILFEIDPLLQKGKTDKNKRNDGNVFENFQTKKSGTESDSDSELSVIFMSEEDENFIFVPLHPESSNPESVNKASKLSKHDLENEANRKPSEAIVEERPVVVELIEEVGNEVVIADEDSLPSPCPAGSTKLTEDEGFSKKAKPFESVPKCTNSASAAVTTKENLKENAPGSVSLRILGNLDLAAGKTFNLMSNGGSASSYSVGETSAGNTKAGEKRNHDQSASQYIRYNTQEFCPLQDLKRKNTTNKDESKSIPTSDYSGKPIYAVRNDGYCLPIKDLFQTNAEIPNVEMADSKEETQNGATENPNVNYKANAPEGPIITTIPNVLMSGASSVASMFNTAKSVISNLQSALKPEVESIPRNLKKHRQDLELRNNFPYNLYPMGEEERRYVEKLANQEKYVNAMLTLHEMGFINYDLNFRLLKQYDNEVSNVINEILDMSMVETPQDGE